MAPRTSQNPWLQPYCFSQHFVISSPIFKPVATEMLCSWVRINFSFVKSAAISGKCQSRQTPGGWRNRHHQLFNTFATHQQYRSVTAPVLKAVSGQTPGFCSKNVEREKKKIVQFGHVFSYAKSSIDVKWRLKTWWKLSVYGMSLTRWTKFNSTGTCFLKFGVALEPTGIGIHITDQFN